MLVGQIHGIIGPWESATNMDNFKQERLTGCHNRERERYVYVHVCVCVQVDK